MKINLQSWASRMSNFTKATFLLSILFLVGCHKGHDNPTAKVTTIATGLVLPMGLETDNAGNIWVAETGTANNDGKVVIVKPNGTKYDAIQNLSSIKNASSGEEEGPSNLILDHNFLYVLAGDYLYKINVAGFRPGDKVIDATNLSHEDIGTYVRGLNIVVPNDSHPYNLIKGPDGDIYITDAGANAIIHRHSAGNYSVLAKFPTYANPTPVGPPQVQAVPTGIIFDGHDFLVSTLTGFPFLPNKANIYRVSLTGTVSVYQAGFTTLTNICDGNIYGHGLLHHANFGQTGFAPNTGSFMLANGSTSKVLVDKLNMPVGLKQINFHSWYISSMGDGTILRVDYE